MINSLHKQNKFGHLPGPIILVLLVIVFGTLGYMLIEQWTFIESFYMTIITLSTVGYKEVRPLNSAGMFFTVVLIITGVCVVGYTINWMGRTIIEGELRRHRELKKMQKKITALRDHTIICGYGKLGKIVTKELIAEGQDVVVIEQAANEIAELENTGISYIQGSAYEDEVLIKAGIDKAKNLLALLSHDADNVYVTLCARDLNDKLRIIARTEGESGDIKLKRAGADQVIAPYRVSGVRISQQLIRPHVSAFLEIAGDRGISWYWKKLLCPKNHIFVERPSNNPKYEIKLGPLLLLV